MKVKISSQLRLCLYLAAIIFIILLATAFIMVSIAFFFLHIGKLQAKNGNALAPLIILLFSSVIVGTFISFFVGKKILKPITKFGNVSNEVAMGNFDVRLEETSNIEEIRDFSRNFNLMVQELSNIETLQNDFVINVSHEFKTPIAAIEGYATLLQDNELSVEDRQDYTLMIIESARQLANLSGNILNLSKLENQELAMEKAPYRLDEQLRQAILFLETEWSGKDLQLHLELPKLTYYGNQKLMMMVWQNLIGNAIKFTAPGGSIGVHLSSTASEIMTKISDTGCGMSPAIQKHAFDKFYQGDSSRKSSGNGLGLALVKRIIDLCGGEISIDSSENAGTTITVILSNNTKARAIL